ncbi:hypothetical protein AVEN_29233-1 [Araneus ventricosus]|uniref:Uncharacterized protein n=1 Tax=Araneus ventricosus TaxID=182803 RepID=A0A4Y2DY12_ARAVE|nr:hypothetical protein AVEN_29233-1 [Araneus ventricosus]
MRACLQAVKTTCKTLLTQLDYTCLEPPLFQLSKTVWLVHRQTVNDPGLQMNRKNGFSGIHQPVKDALNTLPVAHTDLPMQASVNRFNTTRELRSTSLSVLGGSTRLHPDEKVCRQREIRRQELLSLRQISLSFILFSPIISRCA